MGRQVFRIARAISVTAFIAFGLSTAAHAANYVVNQTGSQSDASSTDGFCDTNPAAGNQNLCTLRAAIQEANAVTGPHNITFMNSITALTLTADLPTVTAPVNINGANGSAVGGRVDVNGNQMTSSFAFSDSGTAVNPQGARGSTIRNLVIRNFNDDGISLSGHGYTVENCYVGVTPNGESASANTGDGVSISGTIPRPLGMLPPLPGGFDFDPAAIAGQLITLFSSIPPSTIQNSLISGNTDDGINIFGMNTALVIVTLNRIGTDDDGMSSIPNGTGGGNKAGIRIESTAWANVIGPFNVISGNNEDDGDDGIQLVTGSVLFPNFIAGNSIGIGASPLADVGNGGSGIVTDIRPEEDGTQPDNPTGYGAFIIGNVISDNRGDNNNIDPDDGNGPEAGLAITGTSRKVKVTANFIGVGKFGPTPELSLDFGNAGEGIFLGTSENEIGGSEAADFNVITGNKRHGILVAGGSSTHDNIIRNNFIGVPDPTMLNILTFGNAVDGIQVHSATTNTIGGPGPLDDNVIAGNGRHGISVRGGGTTSGWANLLQRNQIYGNATTNPVGIGIDLERVVNGVDPIPDPIDPDPNDLYANMGQNQPAICAGQPGEPPACAGATPPSFGGSNTSLQWTLSSRPNSTFRIEFFVTTPTAQTFLMEQMVTTDAAGLVTGAGCVAGLCTSAVGGSMNTQTMQLQMTATDLFPTDVPPVGTGPLNAPANNTSEFSNAVTVAQPGEVRFSAASYSVGEAGVMATITVQRVGGSDNAVTVDYATSDGTAGAADYTAASGTVSFADGDATPQTFVVPIASDLLDEPDETVNLTLSNVTGGATIGTPSAAILTITDDDAAPTISVNDVSLPEGDSGTTPFAFDVTLSSPSAQTVTVNFATANSGATTPGDYANTVVTVTFAPGDTLETVVVDVVGDTTSEGNEDFLVNLSAATNATIADNQGTGTIVDDDAGPVFTIDDASQAEGNGGTTNVMFTVSRSPATGAATVDVATADGTATAGSDYTAIATTTLNFADGVATMPVVVQVSGDTTFEPDETYSVQLSNATGGATIGDATGAGTIVNDDGTPTLSIADFSAVEGNAGTSAFTFAVTLSNPSSTVITASATTSDSGATAGSDYTALAAAPITFAPGDVAETVTVTVTGDTTSEPDETFDVTLSAPSGATLADATAIGTILDDDNGAVFTIDDVTLAEGNAGTTTFTFTVTRSATTGIATVQAATSDGSATAGSDYTAIATQTLTFADGVATQPFAVTVSGDTVTEGDETFFVNLANASAGTTIADATGNGTITNDDAQPAIAIADVSALEGNAGTSAFVFTITLDHASSQAITVSAATADSGATAGSDYVALAATPVTFVAGDVSETVTVTVNGDTTSEPTEDFVVNLSLPVNATLADAQATGTIVDDDSGAVFVIDDVTLAEGNAGTSTMTFTVSRSPATGAATIDAATANLTATAGSDYVALTQTLSFADGVATQPFAVTINGDTTTEPDEMFTVTLTNASVGTIGDATGTGTITNDDATPGIAIADVTQVEGNAGTSAFVFTATLSNASSQTVTVSAASANLTATAGSDYTALAATTLTFAPGDTSETVTVTVNGDTTSEPDETFVVNLSGATNASVADPQATGTITNDDGGASVFSIDDVAAPEGNVGTSAFAFTVTRTDTTAAATVDVTSADGSATAGSDYTALATQTLNFAVGIATQPVVVQVTGDTSVEPNEMFTLTLTNATGGATIGDATGTGTITNDDGVITTYTGPTLPGPGIFIGTFTDGGPNCTYVLAQSALLAPPPGVAPVPPSLPVPGAVFPYGLFQSTLTGCTVGGTVNFVYTYPQVLPPGTVFWKYGRTTANTTPHWYAHPATIVGNQISFSITDGGDGDDDLTANGSLIDPAGPAFVVTGTGGGPVSIPALDWRGLVLIAFLMMVFAIRARRVVNFVAVSRYRE